MVRVLMIEVWEAIDKGDVNACLSKWAWLELKGFDREWAPPVKTRMCCRGERRVYQTRWDFHLPKRCFIMSFPPLRLIYHSFHISLFLMNFQSSWVSDRECWGEKLSPSLCEGWWKCVGNTHHQLPHHPHHWLSHPALTTHHRLFTLPLPSPSLHVAIRFR